MVRLVNNIVFILRLSALSIFPWKSSIKSISPVLTLKSLEIISITFWSNFPDFNYQLFEGKFLPIIPIRLKDKDEWVEFKAFIDTGASYCLFHADVAEVVGIKLKEGQKEEMTLGDGDVLEVYVHNFVVSIAGKEFQVHSPFSSTPPVSPSISKLNYLNPFFNCLLDYA